MGDRGEQDRDRDMAEDAELGEQRRVQGAGGEEEEHYEEMKDPFRSKGQNIFFKATSVFFALIILLVVILGVCMIFDALTDKHGGPMILVFLAITFTDFLHERLSYLTDNNLVYQKNPARGFLCQPRIWPLCWVWIPMAALSGDWVALGRVCTETLLDMAVLIYSLVSKENFSDSCSAGTLGAQDNCPPLDGDTLGSFLVIVGLLTMFTACALCLAGDILCKKKPLRDTAGVKRGRRIFDTSDGARHYANSDDDMVAARNFGAPFALHADLSYVSGAGFGQADEQRWGAQGDALAQRSAAAADARAKAFSEDQVRNFLGPFGGQLRYYLLLWATPVFGIVCAILAGAIGQYYIRKDRYFDGGAKTLVQIAGIFIVIGWTTASHVATGCFTNYVLLRRAEDPYSFENTTKAPPGIVDGFIMMCTGKLGLAASLSVLCAVLCKIAITIRGAIYAQVDPTNGFFWAEATIIIVIILIFMILYWLVFRKHPDLRHRINGVRDADGHVAPVPQQQRVLDPPRPPQQQPRNDIDPDSAVQHGLGLAGNWRGLYTTQAGRNPIIRIWYEGRTLNAIKNLTDVQAEDDAYIFSTEIARHNVLGQGNETGDGIASFSGVTQTNDVRAGSRFAVPGKLTIFENDIIGFWDWPKGSGLKTYERASGPPQAQPARGPQAAYVPPAAPLRPGEQRMAAF